MPDPNPSAAHYTPIPRSTIRPVLRPTIKPIQRITVADLSVSARASRRPPKPQSRKTTQLRVVKPAQSAPKAEAPPIRQIRNAPLLISGLIAEVAVIASERLAGVLGVLVCVGVMGFFVASLWAIRASK